MSYERFAAPSPEPGSLEETVRTSTGSVLPRLLEREEVDEAQASTVMKKVGFAARLLDELVVDVQDADEVVNVRQESPELHLVVASSIKNCRGLAAMTAWRAEELFRNGIVSLAAGDWMVAALCGRAFIERDRRAWGCQVV